MRYRNLSGATIRDAAGRPLDRGIEWVDGNPRDTAIHIALVVVSLGLLGPSLIVGTAELLGAALGGPVGELVRPVLGFSSEGGEAVSLASSVLVLIDVSFARRRPIHRIGVSATALRLGGWFRWRSSFPWESVRWSDGRGLVIRNRRGHEFPVRLTEEQALEVARRWPLPPHMATPVSP